MRPAKALEGIVNYHVFAAVVLGLGSVALVAYQGYEGEDALGGAAFPLAAIGLAMLLLGFGLHMRMEII